MCPDLTAACSELCCSIGVCKTLPACCEGPHCTLDIANHGEEDWWGSQLALHVDTGQATLLINSCSYPLPINPHSVASLEARSCVQDSALSLIGILEHHVHM